MSVRFCFSLPRCTKYGIRQANFVLRAGHAASYSRSLANADRQQHLLWCYASESRHASTLHAQAQVLAPSNSSPSSAPIPIPLRRAFFSSSSLALESATKTFPPHAQSSISPSPPYSPSPEPTPVPSDAQRQTIYALATPPGKGGVAVIRISGPDALAVFRRVGRPVPRRRRESKRKGKDIGTGTGTGTGRKGKDAGEREGGREGEFRPKPWRMLRRTIVDPVSGEELDDALVVFFKGPHSFTTEDVLELHLHSGRAIIASVLSALGRLSLPSSSSEPDSQPILLRPAERGEFTKRAYLGGRLDLTQAEAVRDLVDAETEAQRRVALSAARGRARTKFESMREEIIRAMAMTEALIDFGEGEDIEEGVFNNATRIVERLRRTIAGHLADSRRGEIIRSGLRLAIFGPPNAGKSSLLNYLAGREAAIVTPTPGTTRDVLELTLDIGGLPVVVADTAGLRKTDDAVEQIGVERAQQRIAESDVSLCVLSIPDVLADGEDGMKVRLPEDVRELITPSTFVLLNKTDLFPSSLSNNPNAEKALSETLTRAGCCAGAWSVSLTCGEGLERFMSEFGRALGDRYVPGKGSEPLVANERQRAQMEAALQFLDAFLQTEDVVLAAEELRYAANAIGKVTGVGIGVEDVLDLVFSSFCIGK